HYYRTVGIRQFLAWKAGEKQRAHATHLNRAAKGAIITLLILALLLFLASRLSAAPNDHRDVLGLLDLSRSVSAEDFRANVDGVSSVLTKLQTGDRVIVLGITGGFGKSILLDEVMPADAGYLGLQRESGREIIVQKWKTTSKNLRPT